MFLSEYCNLHFQDNLTGKIERKVYVNEEKSVSDNREN